MHQPYQLFIDAFQITIVVAKATNKFLHVTKHGSLLELTYSGHAPTVQ